MRNITLAIEDDVLEEARVLAAENRTTVNAMVRDFLRQATARRAISGRAVGMGVRAAVEEASGGDRSPVTTPCETSHRRMQRILEEGQARYAGSKWFDREYIHDRDYQRAEGYFENRAALLRLIDESTADMGRQKWSREALYDR